MFRNVYYNKSESSLYLWETVEGFRNFRKIDWVPYLYLPDKNGDVETLWGEKASKKEFKDYRAYKVFDDAKDIVKFENHMRPEIQFLAEQYHKFDDNEIVSPLLRIAYFDIETLSNKPGFTKAIEADGIITAISILINDELKIFGIKPYTGKHRDCFVYCKDEKTLIHKFLKYFNSADVDVLTGWNIEKYDLTFIYRRCQILFGEDNKIFSLFSSVRKVNVWTSRADDEILNFNFAGVSILDYLKVYKNYSKRNVESYKLNYIAEVEVGEKKLEYPGTLKSLYEDNWELYIDYNVQDILLIKKIEDTLQYIALVQSISLITRCPMDLYDSAVNLSEGMFLTYYRRNNLCAPTFKGGKQKNFEAGFCKEPIKGLHKWVIDFDVTSMYPHNIIVCNMSIETYFGCIKNLTEDEIIQCIKNKEFTEITLEKEDKEKILSKKEVDTFNSLFRNKKFSIAPNGAIFNNSKEGVIPKIEKKFFLMRKALKKKMLDAKKNNAPAHEVVKLHCAQYAFKILINSVYGVISSPYSRLFNYRVAEAIPTLGRFIIKSSSQILNEFFDENSPESILKIEDL